MTKIILTTGGTGGHIFPALAVAEELRAHYKDLELVFIGSNYGPEAHLVTKANLPFVGLEVRGFLGRNFKALIAGFKMLKAIAKALKFMREFKPDCVVGFGSYAAFAPMLAAQILGIPTILHEQNAIAGFSNRLLGKRAKKICVTHPDTLGFIPEKCVLTGNPVRKSLLEAAKKNLAKPKAFDSKHLLIIGGSQGAHALNQFVLEHLKDFDVLDISVFLQTGSADLELLKSRCYDLRNQSRVHLEPFIDDMAKIYDWADLILCRSGATTLAEISVMGLPAIFVPFPHAIHDHQKKNALSVVKADAAYLIAEEDLYAAETFELIYDLLADPEKLQAMHEAALSLAKPEASANVVKVIAQVLQKNSEFSFIVTE